MKKTNPLRALSIGILLGLAACAALSHPSDVAGMALFSFVGVWP